MVLAGDFVGSWKMIDLLKVLQASESVGFQMTTYPGKKEGCGLTARV